MSRSSCDQYILPTGIIVNAPQPYIEEIIKDGGRLYNGFNYEEQKWYYQGAPDTRSLEELRANL